jgi:hypothetical protein
MHQGAMNMDDFMTVNELSRIIGITPVSCYKKLERKEFPGKKFGQTWMIRRSDAVLYAQALTILDDLRARAQDNP